jgi:exodeoxyribonuclease VII large subunit
VDITLCDLVADLRAPTPSAAAEAAVPSRDALALELRSQRQRLLAAMEGCLYEPRRRAMLASQELTRSASRAIESRRPVLSALAGRLDALSPLATLGRGYAVATDATGRTLASAADFAPGQPFALRLRDGTIDAVARTVRTGVQSTEVA